MRPAGSLGGVLRCAEQRRAHLRALCCGAIEVVTPWNGHGDEAALRIAKVAQRVVDSEVVEPIRVMRAVGKTLTVRGTFSSDGRPDYVTRVRGSFSLDGVGRVMSHARGTFS